MKRRGFFTATIAALAAALLPKPREDEAATELARIIAGHARGSSFILDNLGLK